MRIAIEIEASRGTGKTWLTTYFIKTLEELFKNSNDPMVQTLLEKNEMISVQVTTSNPTDTTQVEGDLTVTLKPQVTTQFYRD